MQELPLDERVAMTLPYLERAGWVSSPPPEETLATVRRIVEAAGDRIKVAGDVLDYADFFLPDEELPYDEKAFQKRIAKPPEAADLLGRFRQRLAACDSFEAEPLEALMRGFTEDEGIKLGQIIHAVRVAATGKAVGFGLFEILEVLGRERTLARIERALERLEAGAIEADPVEAS